MSIKLADTLAPMGDFPAVESDNVDITIDGSPKSLQQAYEDGDLGDGGSSIQVETMPAASAENVGKIVQYVGESGTYQKGHFYECILAHNGAGSIYAWEDVDHLRFNHVVYHCTVPPVNEECKPGDIIYYSGKTMGNFKNGYYYRAIPNATPQQHYGATFWTTPSFGTGYLCYTPFELRIGFIVYPTGTGGTSYPYEITDFDDTGITITPYGWSGEDHHYVGVSYTKTVEGWEELGSGGNSIFYGTMDEWDELSTDAKKQYDYMADDDAGGSYIDTYSTSEVKTNKTWIDGKPIYRKVFVSESDSIGFNTHLETPYIDIIVNQGVLYRRIQNDSCTPIIYKHGTGETAYITLKWSTAGEFGDGYSWWVEYTKTTD